MDYDKLVKEYSSEFGLGRDDDDFNPDAIDDNDLLWLTSCPSCHSNIHLFLDNTSLGFHCEYCKLVVSHTLGKSQFQVYLNGKSIQLEVLDIF